MTATFGPARWLANGLINAYWRNKSGIENIHAGEWEARPLLQRRITPMQEYTIVHKVAEGIVPSMHAIYNVVNKKSEEVAYRLLSCAVVFAQTKLQVCSRAGTGQVKHHLTWRGNPKGKTAWLVKRRILPTGLGE